MAGRFSVEAVFKAIDRFTAPVAKMTGGVDRFAQKMTKSLANIDRLNSRVHEGIVAVAATTAVAGAGAALAIGKIAGAGADFEEAITAAGAVSLMTRNEIASLEKKALELGASTKFSATEVAQGMELMGRAGFNNEQILQGIGGVLNAAAAEGAELAETAGNVSNVLKGMGLATEKATHVADVLTLASARTNSSITSLGESMKNLAPVARQFKIPMEQAVGMVALLQDVGMDASEAGTATATMLTKLAAPTKDAVQQMQALGIKFQDLNGNMLAPTRVLEQMIVALQKSKGNMKQVAFFADLVGLRGQKAALNLADLAKSGKLGELFGELATKADGAAEKMANLRMQNVKGDLEQLGGAVETFQIELYNLNSEGLRKVIQGTTSWIEANKAFGMEKIQSGVTWLVANLPLIWMWTKRIGVGVAAFYLYAAGVKVAMLATWAFQQATTVAGFVLNALSIGLRIAAAMTNLENLSLAALTARLWLTVAAQRVVALATWASSAASAFWSAVLSTGTYVLAIQTAGMWLARTAMAAWYAAVGIATALRSGLTLATVAGTIAQVASTAAIWLAVAALEAINFVIMASPVLILAGILIGIVYWLLKVTGAWDAIKNAVVRFGSSSGGIIGSIVEKVKTLFGWISKAASALGSFLSMPDMNMGMPPGGGFRMDQADAQGNPQVVPPANGTSSEDRWWEMSGAGTVTIKDQTGKAAITEQPKSGFRLDLDMQQSGGF